MLCHYRSRRGVSIDQLKRFFEEHCGSVVYENGSQSRPLCVATHLARKCVLWNKDHREDIFSGAAQPMAPGCGFLSQNIRLCISIW